MNQGDHIPAVQKPTLRTVEALNIFNLLLLQLVALIFFQRIPAWPTILVGNALVIGLILVLARESEFNSRPWIVFFRDWLPVPLILYTFKETYLMVHPINPVDYDWLLIDLDRWLFGTDPTRWLAQYASPVLTEYLQIIYSTFYVFPLLLLIFLYRSRRQKDFHLAVFIIAFGFYLSYIGYFLIPALGPRFTLHDFLTLDRELPGLAVSKLIRWFINTAENIPPDALNPAAFAQRDTFPSGHTEITLIVMVLSTKFRLRSQRLFYPVGISLIFATVYLRYHYVVDLIAGAVFMIITLAAAPFIDRWWSRRATQRGSKEPSPPVAEAAK